MIDLGIDLLGGGNVSLAGLGVSLQAPRHAAPVQRARKARLQAERVVAVGVGAVGVARRDIDDGAAEQRRRVAGFDRVSSL